VIYAESDEPPGLPDLDIQLIDGRARIGTPWGDVGIRAEGEGELDDGFEGTLAAIAPAVRFDGCTIERMSVFGDIRVTAGRPVLAGPLRTAGAQCPGQGLSLARADFTLGLTGDATLDGADIRLEGRAGRIAFDGGSVEATRLGTQASLRGGRLVARFDSSFDRLRAGGTGFADLALTGGVRTDTGFKVLQSDVEIAGDGLVLDPAVLQRLHAGTAALKGTLAEPLLAQLTGAIEREVVGSTLAAEMTLRATDDGLTVVAPRASLRARTGDVLATLTRFQLRSRGSGVPLVSGNIAMGGKGLPQLRGRMERDGGGSVFRLQMAPYRAH
jgi:hypothetical protein